MKHLGDITKLNGADLPLVDIICGGSPCQDLSVAGKRAGLSGERSGLFMEQIRVIKEMRNECIRQLSMRGAVEPVRPRYMVWENVPGAFSSNKGEDFRCVLEETAKVAERDARIPGPPGGKWPAAGTIMGNGWSIAWRVHDAQFWGVPQRRKRIALVADFGGLTAPEILFERESVSGDSEESREEGEGIATAAQSDSVETISFQERAGKPGGGKGILIQNERVGALSTLNNQSVLSIDEKMGQTYIGEEVGNTLGARDYKQPQAVCCGVDAYNFKTTGEIAVTLNATSCDSPSHSGPAVCTYQQTTGALTPGAHPGSYNGSLNSAATDSDHIPCVYGLDRASFNQGQNAQYDFSIEEEIAQTLVSRGPGGVLSNQ